MHGGITEIIIVFNGNKYNVNWSHHIWEHTHKFHYLKKNHLEIISHPFAVVIVLLCVLEVYTMKADQKHGSLVNGWKTLISTVNGNSVWPAT